MELIFLPKIKTEREEFVIYRPEWEKTLADAKEYSTWLAAWLAFDCIFGKRRNEICKLKRKDIWIQSDFLFVRFYVGKKKSKKATIDKLPYTKKKALQHSAIHYILEYLKEWDTWRLTSKRPTEYLFPMNRKDTKVTVHTKCILADGTNEVREYHYSVEGGYISGALVNYYMKKINPKIWLHLGRHTVGTLAAESGASEYDVSNILDVTARTASRYVHHGTALTEKWSSETG